VEDFKKVFQNYLYTGQYSKFWKKERGTDASVHPGRQFVVAVQNHDQVDNRARDDRLSTLVEFPYLKAAAGLVLFSAYLPLIFMGEEYGEQRPFMFFTDYQDPELQKAVSRGRREEFKEFTWENVPDPQGESTFYESKLTPQSQWDEQNRFLFKFYQDMIQLRATHPVLKILDKDNLEVEIDNGSKLVRVTRRNQDLVLTGLFNLGSGQVSMGSLNGRLIFNSESEPYGGKGDGEVKYLSRGQVVIFER
jgi:maltooligosyltrehalose trehalohydrolase